MDIEKAVEHFKQLVETDEMAVSCLKPDEMEKSIQAEWLQYNKLAVKALQAQTTSCEWCDGEAHYLSQSDYTLLGIQGNTLYASGDDCTDIQINYCPMCGRKLK